jgi:CheY-like chemotaxis protein
VEDEPQVRNVSVEALRDLGYTVLQAPGPNEALDQLGAQPSIDLLFTDIVMPAMSGRQLADKALALRPDLKVLFTTGYTRNAVVHNGVLDPGTAFLQKPFSVEQLAVKVREVLDEAKQPEAVA